MNIRLGLNQPLRGRIEVPGDKSISHRAVILGGIAGGVTCISNFLDARDPRSTLNCIQQLGVQAEIRGTDLKVYGVGLDGLKEPQDVLNAGNSGTTIRLLSGILAGQDFYSVLTGDGSLRSRPMARITQPLRNMGANIDGRACGSLAPLSIRGGSLSGTHNRLDIASAQVKSAILLAGLFASGETVVVQPADSRDHTERMLMEMGASVVREKGTVSVRGGYPLKGLDIKIPGDISSAAFFITAACIVEGSSLCIPGVGVNPTRTGLIEVLKQMGAQIRMENGKNSAGEPVADLYIKGSRLKAVEIGGDIIPSMIDEIPVLAVAASLAEGKTVIRDAGELRVKESNRLNAIARELGKMGADIRELPDGLEIKGKEQLSGAVCDSHGDHRIAMALAVASLVAKGETTITRWECVNISFPGFLPLFKGCIGNVEG